MTRPLILVIEDDEDIRSLVKMIVAGSGCDPIECTTGAEGIRLFYERRPDLVILDVGLPELDGWGVLERIRELSDVPVLMLTASSGEPEKVRGLRGGADDYVTKPFGRHELLARVEALLRRGGGRESHEVYADELLRIDFSQRRVTIADEEVPLTPTEFKLMAAFARHPNQILSRDQLLELVWGPGAEGSGPEVKVYVGYLRRKLREAGVGDPVETIRGFGYRYRPGVTPG